MTTLQKAVNSLGMRHHDRFFSTDTLSIGEPVHAFRLREEKVKSNLKPSQEYLNLILEGKNFMSKEYYNNLRNIL